MLVEIDDEQYDDLVLLSDMLNKSIINIVDDAINKEIKRYSFNDKLYTIKAKFWSNRLECTLGANKGNEIEKIFKDVYVIGKTEIYGSAYYKIICDGSFMTVPYETIIFDNEDDKFVF